MNCSHLFFSLSFAAASDKVLPVMFNPLPSQAVSVGADQHGHHEIDPVATASSTWAGSTALPMTNGSSSLLPSGIVTSATVTGGSAERKSEAADTSTSANAAMGFATARSGRLQTSTALASSGSNSSSSISSAGMAQPTVHEMKTGASAEGEYKGAEDVSEDSFDSRTDNEHIGSSLQQVPFQHAETKESTGGGVALAASSDPLAAVGISLAVERATDASSEEEDDNLAKGSSYLPSSSPVGQSELYRQLIGHLGPAPGGRESSSSDEDSMDVNDMLFGSRGTRGPPAGTAAESLPHLSPLPSTPPVQPPSVDKNQ